MSNAQQDTDDNKMTQNVDITKSDVNKPSESAGEIKAHEEARKLGIEPDINDPGYQTRYDGQGRLMWSVDGIRWQVWNPQPYVVQPEASTETEQSVNEKFTLPTAQQTTELSSLGDRVSNIIGGHIQPLDVKDEIVATIDKVYKADLKRVIGEDDDRPTHTEQPCNTACHAIATNLTKEEQRKRGGIEK